MTGDADEHPGNTVGAGLCADVVERLYLGAGHCRPRTAACLVVFAVFPVRRSGREPCGCRRGDVAGLFRQIRAGKGRLAGGTVNATSAQPGTASLINFRGVSSVFGAQTPVIYVDGVRVDTDMDTAMDTGGENSSALADILAYGIHSPACATVDPTGRSFAQAPVLCG